MKKLLPVLTVLLLAGCGLKKKQNLKATEVVEIQELSLDLQNCKEVVGEK